MGLGKLVSFVFFLIGVTLAISISSQHESEVFGFGNNNDGQLGISDEDIVNSPTKIKIDGENCIRQADGSGPRSILVSCDGKVYVQGANIASTGRFDISSNVRSEKAALVVDLAHEHIVQASAGDSHFIVISNQGKVFTWGLNGFGQLGVAQDLPYSPKPIEVTSLSRKNIRLVNAGGNHSAAISDRGELFIWGDGKMGEMGDGSNKNHKIPTLVEALNVNGQRVCQVSLGDHHVAAVTNQGDLYTWGDGTSGQLGHGTFGIQKSKPVNLNRLRKNVCHVSSGSDFTTAITQDERMFLWGSNGYPAPFEKVYLQGLHPRQAGSGSTHIVVLLSNGSVVTWGSVELGQIGRPSPRFTLEPNFINTTKSIRQVTVGSDSTILISGDISSPSLCPCFSNWFSYWRNEIEFKATCSNEQTQCNDGSCCDQDETCCARVDNAESNSVRFYRAIDGKPYTNVSSSYYCVKSKNAQCCSVDTPFACPSNYNCVSNSIPPRCEPSSRKIPLSAQERLENSVEVIKKINIALPPGFIAGENGSCGPRKETCADESCCAKGQTCCGKDGGYGCCPHSNGVCCEKGCCQEGFTCDNENLTCVKETSKIEQEKIEGHCGNNKMTCPDSSCCSGDSTCCVLNDGFFGCCPFTNGICCVDGAGCCPGTYKCDVPNAQCVKTSIVDFGSDAGKIVESRMSMKSTPRNTAQRSEVSSITCGSGDVCQYPGTCCPRANGQFSCCDFINGTCCSGGLGCCPNDYECDVGGNTCKSLSSSKFPPVPMKFVRDPKPPQPGSPAAEKNRDICQGRPKCDDDTCCPLSTTCCSGPSGTFCCNRQNATCCPNGGCCSGGDTCDSETNSCIDYQGRPYAFLASQKPSEPIPPFGASSSFNTGISAPESCYADERLCADGFCCPRSSTCCNKGYGQYGCCPNTAAVCCDGGGCCPYGATCDLASNSCISSSHGKTPIIQGDLPHPPEAKYDVEECWEDEQTCAGDAGCCLKSETCCLSLTEEGPVSTCCPFEDGVCCGNGGGCCPSMTECNLQLNTCVNVHGETVHDLADLKGSVSHPIGAIAETDCPDGSVCGAFDTCCSLGVDEKWGEELFGCCPFENAICCKEFEGCCPSGYECDSESKGCIGNERTIKAGSNSPTEPPPTYVCALPKTQCLNGRCCEQNEQCVETEFGNYKCMERGYVYCNNSYACPSGLYCDERNSKVVCSEVQDNDEQVKENLLRAYWGESYATACHSILLQQQQDGEKSFAPTTESHKAEVQLWYPKKLVMKAPAIRVKSTSLPTILAAKVCQHLKIVNSTAVQDLCLLTNSNGHFIIKDRPRAKQLIDEYMRRICYFQNCEGEKGLKYEFVPEELNPCPCRQPPPHPKNITEEAGADNQEAIITKVASAEEQSNSVPTNKSNSLPNNVNKSEEKKITTVRTSTKGEVPLALEKSVDEDPKYFQLVPPSKDTMRTSLELETNPNIGDKEMITALPTDDTFMGKNGCQEDVTESAVDLDGETAIQMDKKAEMGEVNDLSLSQMNFQINSKNNFLPDTE